MGRSGHDGTSSDLDTLAPGSLPTPRPEILRIGAALCFHQQRRETAMGQGLGSSTWWEAAEYKQLETENLRALFILDKLIKADFRKFQVACAVAFPGRLMSEPAQIQPDEITRGPWLVILTRMGATREETTDILERVGRRW
jgi:hypothetical protein